MVCVFCLLLLFCFCYFFVFVIFFLTKKKFIKIGIHQAVSLSYCIVQGVRMILQNDKCTWKRKHSLWPLTCHLVYRRCIINKQLLHLFLHWLDISHRTWNNEEIRVICFISKYLRSTRIKFNIYTTYAFFSFKFKLLWPNGFWRRVLK